MRTLYYESDIEDLVNSCEDYIEQLDNVSTQEYYKNELNVVKNDFLTLMNSSIAHNAIGKVLNAFENWGQLCVEVETEY